MMAIFLVLLLGMIAQLYPLIVDIVRSGGNDAGIAEQIDAVGWRGVPALIGLSAIQVIILIIPAPAVGVLTGVTYGILWGPLIYLAGITLGHLFVMVSMRRLHGLLASRRKHKPERKKSQMKEKLENMQRPEIAAFFLVLIPWVSSLGPYLFAETKVVLWKYIVAVLLGSIPFTVVYVFLGDRIAQGSWTAVIITGAVAVAILGIALVFRKKIMAKIMGE